MAVGVLSNVKLDAVSGAFSAKYTADASVSATSVYVGFTPRVIKMTQIGGTPGGTAQSGWFEGMSNGTNWLIGSGGAFSLPGASGYTPLVGSELAPAAPATGSPQSNGLGFTIGTGCQVANIVYFLEAYR